MDTTLFETYAPSLLKSPATARDPRLLIEFSGDLEVFYAPFEFINPDAKIVLVGITPGPTQMVNANDAARKALLAGQSKEEAIKAAKLTGAFSGEPLRGNLTKQLDHWGIHQWLGLPVSSELFATSSPLLQTTSLLRYPVFFKGAPYRGAPDMLKHPLLRKHLANHFAREVRSLPDALFFGLGPLVNRVLEELTREGVLPSERIITGLLHPSGNCTYRINYLTGDRAGPTPHATNPAPYDQGRRAFREAFDRS